MAGQATLSTVQSLYLAYYGRPADPEGLNFWANVVEANGGDINVIIKDFSTAPEYQQRFGSLDNPTLVNNLYLQMFGRNAEPDGLAFWVGQITSGSQTLGQVASTISSLASGIDLQVLSARVELANAFTAELNSDAKLTAYATTRGIEIGRSYLDQVKSTNVGDVAAIIDKAAETAATLPPTTGGGNTGGGGGGVVVPPVAFAATITSGVLTFGGTETTGTITIEEVLGTVSFTRGTTTITKTSAEYATAGTIAAGTASLNISADLVKDHTFTGTGTVTVSSVDANSDLSGLAPTQNVVVQQTVNANISNSILLSNVDSFVVAAGVTLTLSVAQYTSSPVTGAGDYALQDTIANLQAAGTAPITDAVKVIVTDFATVLELSGLSLGSNLVALNIADTILHLLPSGGVTQYITEGTNVTVSDAATISQISLIDVKNGAGGLSYDLVDSAVNVLNPINAAVVTNAESIKLTGYALGDVTVAQVQGLLSLSNLFDNGGDPIQLADLTFNLLDTSFNLISAKTDPVYGAAAAITASDAVSVNTAVQLHQIVTGVAVNYNVTDSVNSLVSVATGAEDAIKAGINVVAIGQATAAQAQVILDRTGSTGTTTYNVTDTYANLTNSSYAATLAVAKDLTVNHSGLTYLSTAQAAAVIDLGADGITKLGAVRGTVSEINAFVNDVDSGFSETKLTYDFYVRDTYANINSAITGNNVAFIEGNNSHPAANIEVTDVLTIAKAEDIWSAFETVFGVSTASKTSYTINDSVANYAAADANLQSILDADSRTVTDTAANVDQGQDSGDWIFNKLNGNDHIIASGSAGEQYLRGSAGSDSLDGGDDNDTIEGNGGSDTIYGGTGVNTLYGGEGRDTIYAGSAAGANTSGANFNQPGNTIYGGQGGDQMFGSVLVDTFKFAGNNKLELAAESGTQQSDRDYISNFSLGDKITFNNDASIQFFGTGSFTATNVTAGTLALSVRYEKDVQASQWDASVTATSTRVFIDVADANGVFDGVADMNIILVGVSIDINQAGTNTLTFGA